MDADVAFRLRLAIGRLARRLRATEAGSGLTPTETSVLFTVVRRGPLGMAELAAIEDLNATMLSRVIARLGKRDLIDRAVDQTDRRAAVIRASTAGAALRRDIQHERATALAQELVQLSPEHRAALVAALPALESLAEQMRHHRGA